MTEIKKTETAPPMDAAETQWRFASALAKATIIPKQYQGQPANCFVAIDMARRLNTGVMEIMQNCNVIHGNPSFSSRYAIAMANKLGPFVGPIAFEQGGTPGNESVTAYAVVEATGKRVEFTADMAMAKAEGWTANKKYKSMPIVMLSYRSASFLIKLYCPEVLFGMQTSEELQDVGMAKAVPSTVLESVNEKIAAGHVGDAAEDEVGTPLPAEPAVVPPGDSDGDLF